MIPVLILCLLIGSCYLCYELGRIHGVREGLEEAQRIIEEVEAETIEDMYGFEKKQSNFSKSLQKAARSNRDSV
jgi:hypothetical protein